MTWFNKKKDPGLLLDHSTVELYVYGAKVGFNVCRDEVFISVRLDPNVPESKYALNKIERLSKELFPSRFVIMIPPAPPTPRPKPKVVLSKNANLERLVQETIKAFGDKLSEPTPTAPPAPPTPRPSKSTISSNELEELKEFIRKMAKSHGWKETTDE